MTLAGKPINLQGPLAFPSAVSYKGSILIIALWSVFILTTMAVSLGYGVRQKIALINRLQERDKLHFIAEAGIKRAIVELKEEPQKPYDALKDYWSNNISVFKAVGIGDGAFNVCYNYIDERTGAVQTQWGLIDEERKININKANLTVLKHLFRTALGFDEIETQELSASIIDWRDSDSELSIPLGSAEDSYYRGLRYPYEAKDAEFEILDELLLVKGMSRDIFERIKNHITIYGNGKININTASRVVLLALGISESIVDKILSFRAGDDEIPATSDDNVFDTPSGIVPKLSQFYRLNDSEIAQISAVADLYLVCSSDNFMIISIANLGRRKNTAEIICVVNRSGEILHWQELS